MADDGSPIPEGFLPPEFWSAPERFIKDQTYRLMHTEVLSRLRTEHLEADTLEQLCMERVASLYFYMRDRESQGMLDNASAYKGIMTLWVSMAADLRKTRELANDADSVKAKVIRDVAVAVQRSVKGLEPEVQMMVQSKILEGLEAA